ncbi:SEC14 domain and spectrin repeat-containing protein 1-B isoform X1 [Bactrocera neohumeralis]|uniref:SEC14 domain and spectrin repeat-containing protein 1-B isoform X1 n=1 Tax=Bactrocera neohumeralis TaxID=98809 RepID=UPI0021657711|nr:SEC14 domain and spectrin repeat-containing protein 1-B isoform X1 [Bactrocera neohumeralis]XP_050335999.1 SEC14 domain and spectrin repeat-containing protein 1-B isoform X1 [Bactrocera neohumeralis]
MEEDVLNALQTRTAYLPGGYDRAGKIIVVVNIINDLQLWNRRCLELSIAYLKSALSAATLQRGVTVIVDAQKSTTRITRTHARIIYALFDEITVNLFLVRAEGFWEKHVDTCTSKSQAKGEFNVICVFCFTHFQPVVLSKARLIKYFDLSQLPEELGGTLSFNYDLWLQQRKAIDEFQKTFDSTLSSMENLHVVLLNNKSLRPTEADVELKKCAQLHTSVQQQIEVVIELGNRVLNRLSEAYAPPRVAPTPQISATTNVLTPAINSTATTSCHESHNNNNNSVQTQTNFNCATANTPATRLPLPPDLQYARARIELLLNQIERKQTEIRTAWLELLQSIREARELTHLEEGVAFVTNWILQTAEQMLSRQYSIGGDVHSCETLRAAHDVLELECRETYGFYAELLYKIDAFAGVKDSHAYKDLMSQCDFMQFVCRSFATRLERRRNVLITSLRFFRLVSEYFDRTTAVFETLVMGNKIAEENFVTAAETLQQLKESQLSLGNLERELVKEGEKLSDMLAMPVKDALGRDLHIDYSEDIGNVRDILDTTLARRNIFGDSVELQKLTLEQVTHIYTYEADGRMAIKWMEDLYNVMIKCHSHVGCNIHEIQVQKDELQTFQETGKSIYNYGCQLLEASQALRISCRLDAEAIPQRMSQQLQHTWHRLQAVSQEHMTRLRVSAVFHRSVEEYCQQLQELRLSVRNLKQTPNSSSGISSESDTRASPPIIIGGRETVDETVERSSRDGAEEVGTTHSIGGYADKSTTTNGAATTTTKGGASGAAALLRDQLRKHLVVREQLLLEVGRMVRLGRLLKTRLKEPFVLDAVTGMSITVDELATDASSSAGDTQTQSSSSPVGTVDSASTADSNTIVIKPTGNNDIACAAISHKLQEIAEVAESLDAAIRDVQQDAEALEVNATSSAEKKREAMRSYSSEDWHSRSTEDDSFVTASEGNFTPHSHSSSYQTASGRTSSFISCDKSSFDVSEADDSTFASTFEIPADINMSYDGTEHSFVSAQQQDSTPSPQRQELHQQQNINDSPNDGGAYALPPAQSDDGDGSSIADIEELHSQSVTPTPGDGDVEHYNYQSIPIESESDLESSCIADSPSLQVLTEEVPVTSVTPEVSTCSSTEPQQMQKQKQQLQQQPQTNYNNNNNSNTNNNNNTSNTSSNQKPNAAWRRSKYYENITKQTIKGFL